MILLPASLMMPDAIDSAPTWLYCVLYNKDIKHAVNSPHLIAASEIPHGLLSTSPRENNHRNNLLTGTMPSHEDQDCESVQRELSAER
jgi:hypothetical protein